MSFGLTPTGFQIKRLADIKQEIQDTLRALLGPSVNLEPESNFGQLIGVFSERESLIWEQLQVLYDAQYPDTASDNQQDLVNSIVGVTRKPATRSHQAGQLFFGTVGTDIPIGTQISVANSPTDLFQTLSDVTLIAGVSAVQKINFTSIPDTGVFAVGFGDSTSINIPFTANAAVVQSAIDAMPSIGVGNTLVTGSYTSGFTIAFQNLLKLQPISLFTIPVNTLSHLSINTVATPVTLTVGVAQGSSEMDAVNTGPIVAHTGSLTNIITPIFGLDTTYNPVPASIGTDRETDNAYRARREQQLQIAGSSTTGAILAAVGKVSNVSAVFVFENDTPLFDVDGRPPHSIEVVAQGGTDQAVANQIFASKAAGIGTFGTTTDTVIDSQGFAHSIMFSRPTDVPIALEVDLTVDVDLYPVNGDDLVKQNFKTFIDTYTIGETVVVSPDLYACLTGITDLNIEKIPGIIGAIIKVAKKPTAPTASDNIAIDIRSLATVALADIAVVHV